MSLLRVLRLRLRALFRRDQVERELDDELRFHLDMQTEANLRAGIPPAEARRRAVLLFGGVEGHREASREAQGLALMGARASWLDLKLGLRMLRKYPGVSLVGGLALTIGIGIGAAYLEVTSDFLHPSLPLDEGERIVGLQNWDVEENDPEPRSLHDFAAWREELETVDDLAAFRSVERNLGAEGVAGEPAHGAEITPSAFRVARVPALLGRTLLDADEAEGAPPVVVLGYSLWRTRFAADTGVVGRTVRVGGAASTVVGVMPEGFGFPVSHQFWVPLRAEGAAPAPRQGPAVQIFGRLAPGTSLREAQAELSAVGRRRAADLPATHERLRPRVVRYTQLFLGRVAPGGSGPAHGVQFLFVMLLLVLSSNVATLLFARTATRENEIAMRFALGASRGRILAQFFVEALVLSLAATAVALAVVAWGAQGATRAFWSITDGRVPFWLDEGLNASTVLYAVALAVVGSLVAGVVPALKATRSRLRSRLRHPVGGGDSALRFGGPWSGMIVVQVAFAVLVLPPAIVAVSALAEPGYVEPGFPAGEYLAARVEMDREETPADPAAAAEASAEFEAAYREVERRLLARPEVAGVTFASRLPVQNHPQPSVEAEREGGTPGTTEPRWGMATSVDADFFETFGAEIVAGRGFAPADQRPDARVVVVNEHFVSEVLEGRNALGRRIRYSTRFGEREATGAAGDLPAGRMREPGDWYEIVGVVDGLGMDTNRDPFFPGWGPGVYHPLSRQALGSGGAYAVGMAVHVRGDPASLAPRLREIAHAVSPALRLSDVLPMDGPVDRVNRNERRISRFFSWGTALVALVALLVSTAGIYSVLSFTVARQTREIGIRVALGADPRRIVREIFSRAMLQIGAGVVAGYLLWIYLLVGELAEGDFGGLLGTLLAAAGILLLVGGVACGVPVRRALRIEPAEALRDAG